MLGDPAGARQPPGLIGRFECLKKALHKANIERHTVQDLFQQDLASVQRDLASAIAKLGTMCKSFII